jgi:GrpB-like predicted nucleotidyltransferase (UPF0157 family)
MSDMASGGDPAVSQSPPAIPLLGLPHGTVAIHAPDPGWQGLYEAEARLIRAAIGPYILEIEHVGSTSVPGLAAKPILDIAVGVANWEEAVVCVEPMQRLGYIYKGEYGIPRRHYFVKGEPRTHHVHMVELGGDDWRRTVQFRDYLRQHPEAVAAYAELKRRLAQQFPADREAYQNGKDTFIKQVLQAVDRSHS